jgi:CHAD domain-containing protein
MSELSERLLVKISMLEIKLRCCIFRLDDPADSEALHDLRICLRSLRSLLRPLRGLPAVDLLEQACAAVGQVTNPSRELQVFVSELRRLGMQQLADEYSATQRPARVQLFESSELPHLLMLLENFAPIWRLATREGCMRGLHKHIVRRLERGLKKIPHALHASPEDLHVLRLQVKRLRYGSQAYAELTPVSRPRLKLLGQLQQVLGDWNDRQQWLQYSFADERLIDCRPLWSDSAEAYVFRVDNLLAHFGQLAD